jgi:2-phosphosulfolactate phosphatase
MEVRIVDFVAGARSATGVAVVIDVFRAFSVAAHAMARGATTIVPVAEVETARAFKAAHPDWLLVGERHARRLPGFDCGNSPTELNALDLAGRTLIHTTHAGTQGLVNASGADEVLTGALVNAAAIVRYLLAKQAPEVTLVRMGHEARERSDEDDACAEILSERLRGNSPDASAIRSRLRHAAGAQKFFDPACDWAPEGDFNLCTQVDVFDFVLSLDRTAATPCLRRIDVPRAL